MGTDATSKKVNGDIAGREPHAPPEADPKGLREDHAAARHGGGPPTEGKDRKSRLTPLQATLELARRGNVACLPKLREFLDSDSSLWKEAGDVASIVRCAWIDQRAGRKLLHRKGLGPPHRRDEEGSGGRESDTARVAPHRTDCGGVAPGPARRLSCSRRGRSGGPENRSVQRKTPGRGPSALPRRVQGARPSPPADCRDDHCRTQIGPHSLRERRRSQYGRDAEQRLPARDEWQAQGRRLRWAPNPIGPPAPVKWGEPHLTKVSQATPGGCPGRPTAKPCLKSHWLRSGA
jgi:hypothetical protein